MDYLFFIFGGSVPKHSNSYTEILEVRDFQACLVLVAYLNCLIFSLKKSEKVVFNRESDINHIKPGTALLVANNFTDNILGHMLIFSFGK